MGDAMPEAEATVNKALELDPNLVEAHAVRGFIKMFLDWDWNEAEKSLNRAIELDPNSVEARHWRGILYQIRGRFPEAKAELNRALELDPTSANMISDLGNIHYFAGEFAKAEELYKKAESIESNIALHRLVQLYEKQGREAEAFEARVSLVRLQQGQKENREYLDSLRKNFESGGWKGVLRFILNDNLDYLAKGKIPRKTVAVNWYATTILHIRLGERQKAIESLNRAVEARLPYETMNFSFPFIAFDPTFDEIRNEPGFREVLQKVNLP
ncbi:MAG: tetratricopeptide repeat protein [Blastocatellia bacterium]|nr:tetratricopeptide repeat protein [Blastocatellia bacterium]